MRLGRMLCGAARLAEGMLLEHSADKGASAIWRLRFDILEQDIGQWALDIKCFAMPLPSGAKQHQRGQLASSLRP